ncbi:hypothetical protein TRFO_33964 [Tritrichomonas foetus]|uniref:JAB1/MPN/MOV34 metalloenzyme domain-containing protein n=1 Tax=Tritrichomonas foetus TaxID=1144522 RepID=A0A1J4JK80_9EUKA|nr:hypothetical protein TRFO_33964 [Tritrichomonas foetus]|eukprot:OHS99554.1 hypothetical protein TRFO_33964 [Tritrichomonas foetus]
MSSYNVLVHPQAMLVLSNHYSRIKYDKIDPPLPAHCGFLLGNVDGSKIEVTSALEARVTIKDGKLTLDIPFSKRAIDLHRTIYANDLPIGFYVCSTKNKQSEEELRKLDEAFSAFENFDCILIGEFYIDEKNTKVSPLSLHISRGTNLIPVDFTYEAEHAERIAMMQLQSEGDAESQIQFTASAFKSLDHDLSLVQSYLERVAKKELPFDPVLVRKAANFAQWWDHNSTEEENGDRAEEQANLALLCGMMLEAMTAYEEHAKKK